ncbi:undecaprenyl diphosphate synthase family protein [Geoglobus sp.]
MLNLLYRIYQRKLEREVKSRPVPKHIVVVISSDEFSCCSDSILRFVRWCSSFGIEEVTFAVDGEVSQDSAESLARKMDGRVRIITGNGVKVTGSGGITVNLNLGVRGREEVLRAIRSIARDVLSGKVRPENVDEGEIGRRLVIRSEPDVIIRAGLRSRDFLIWQGIYSEHVFFDSDWKNLRYIDFLRILREYQKRERRYGR